MGAEVEPAPVGAGQRPFLFVADLDDVIGSVTDLQTFSTLIDRLPARSLRPGLTRAAATDTAWAIASPDTYDMLVRTRGYTLDQYQTWITTSLTALLLRP